MADVWRQGLPESIQRVEAAMSDNHLYVLRCDHGDVDLMIPCIGNEELEIAMMAFKGARYFAVQDLEKELAYLVRSCHLEGVVKGWNYLG